MDPLKVAAPAETKLHFLDYWRIIRIRKPVILAVFLLVVITATLVTFILPESYSSMTRIKIERDVPDVQGLADRSPMGGYDPYFIQSEFEVIQSELVLGKVIKDLDLNAEWGKKYAGGERLKTPETMQLLKQKMDLRPVRNTTLIEIRVFSENRDEAAKLADAIAEAHRDHRQAERLMLSSGGIKAIEERLADQEAKVREAQTNLDRLREELNIPDAMVGGGGEGAQTLISQETLHRIEGLRIESKAELVRQETLLNGLKALTREQLIQALPTAAQDNLLTSLLEQKTLAEQNLIRLQKDFGPEHVEVKKTKSSVDDLNDKINARVDGILLGLDAKVKSTKADLEDLEKEVTTATTNDIEK